jgi:hypothetical protein
MTSANSLLTQAQSYLDHTNRISGVTPFTGQDLTNPYYDTAMGLGKTALYITNQTDGISNTSPILGSFTSLFISDILTANTIKLTYYANEYANSISLNTDPMTGNTSISSNLANSEIANIQSYITFTTNVLYNQRIQDWTFYQNSLQVSQDASFLQSFSSMGGTMTYLVNNLVGTPSLVAKINS